MVHSELTRHPEGPELELPITDEDDTSKELLDGNAEDDEGRLDAIPDDAALEPRLDELDPWVDVAGVEEGAREEVSAMAPEDAPDAAFPDEDDELVDSSTGARRHSQPPTPETNNNAITAQGPPNKTRMLHPQNGTLEALTTGTGGLAPVSTALAIHAPTAWWQRP